MSLALTDHEFRDSQDSFEIGEIVAGVLRRWRLIAMTAVLCVLLAVYVVMTAVPKFTLNGSIYLGELPTGSGDASGNGNFLTAFQNSDNVNTLVSLLQSHALVEKAILETGLNASVTPVGATSLPFWRWKYEDNHAIEAFAPGHGALIAEDATISDPGSPNFNAIVTFGQNGHFTGTTKASWPHGPQPLFSGALGQPISEAGISMVLKPATAGDMPAPGSRYVLSVAPAKAVADAVLGGALTATAGGAGDSDPTQVVSLRLLSQNPYQGAIFLNQLMQDFIAMQLSWNTESASNTEAFVTQELTNIRSQMQNADQALASYQAKTGILDVSSTAQALINQLSQYEMQRTGLLLKQQALTQLITSFHSGHNADPYLISEINDPVLTTLSNTLATDEVQLNSQGVSYTDQAPEMQVQEAAVSSVRRSTRNLLENDQEIATRDLNNLDAVIAQLQTKLQAMPAESLQVDALMRTSDVSGKLYVLLMQKEEEAEVSKAATITGSRIVSPAEVPLAATTPKATITILGGLLFGLLAGLAIVLVRRASSGRFQSYEEIRRVVPTEILGLVPIAPQLKRGALRLSYGKQTPFCESIRFLRSNLYQSFSQPGAKIIHITSATTGDGKSTVAVNLARFLAEDGKRTILVDADLHRGKLHQYLGVAHAPGVSDYIQGQRAQWCQVDGEKFFLLPCGTITQDPSELLNRPPLEALFGELRANFDYVITDCPPLPVVADTLALARFADIVLSVVCIERTSRRNFSLHLSALRSRNRPHGVVVNGVASSVAAYGYEQRQGRNPMSRGLGAIG